MTSNYYVIDTSSLIELNRHNPRDVYPGVWERIEHLINSERLVSPKEVLYEIKQGDDSLYEWAKKQNSLFVEPSQKQIEIVKDILRTYPSMINTGRRYDADPWVIALALELDRNPQKTLVKIKRIVVTEEKLRGERIRIPFVSEKYAIEAIDIIDMFRAEGWKF